MASQSLPPPPLTCSTPPPIDFGPPEDDEEPFPDEEDDEEEDECQSVELPSFSDEAIPIPDVLPQDPFYDSPPSLTPPPPAVAVQFTRPVETKHIEGEKEVVVASSRLPPEPPVSSIHDLLNNSLDQETILHPEGDETQKTKADKSQDAEDQPFSVDIDNPPSLQLDINSNVSPSTDGNGNLEEFGDFSERITVGAELEDSPESSPFGTPLESTSPRKELRSPHDEVAFDDDIQEQRGDIPEATEDVHDDFGEFVENEVVADKLPEDKINLKDSEDTFSEATAANCDLQTMDEEDGKQVGPNSTPLEQEEEVDEKNHEIFVPQKTKVTEEETEKDDEVDDDFDDFTDFTSAQVVPSGGIESRTAATAAPEVIEPKAVEFEADFDQFANFESFAPIEVEESGLHKAIVTETFRSAPEGQQEEDEDEDDDDDFGDFTSSVPTQANLLPQATPPVEDKLPPIDISNVDAILEEMFPTSENAADVTIGDKQKHSLATILIEARGYETTALTNDYHWSKSTSNNCLVKCLGIDKRNILLGSQWNSEMPRFAANLGFSPLQPMKPAVNTGILRPTPAAGAIKMGVNSGLPVTGDVPVAQFDWDSSGLVNPLHASQAHTYLLDLEQLEVVMASLENTKTASHNTTATTTTTTTTTPAAPDGDDYDSAAGWMGALSDDKGLLEKVDELRRHGYDKFAPFRTMMIAQEEEKECPVNNKTQLKPESTLPPPVGPAVPVEAMKSPLATETETISTKVTDDLPIRSVGDGEASEEPIEDNDINHFVTAAAIVATPSPQVDDHPPSIEYLSPLRETHIFTPPVKGAVTVSREVSGGGGVSEISAEPEIVVKEYRDVEYDPSRFLAAVDSNNTTNAVVGGGGGVDEKNDDEEVVNIQQVLEEVVGQKGIESSFSIAAPEEEEEEDDDFSDFQSVPVVAATLPIPNPIVKAQHHPHPQPLSVNNLSALLQPGEGNKNNINTNLGGHENNLLMPSILMPRPAAGGAGAFESIRWPDNSDQIGQSELERIEEMFSGSGGGKLGSNNGRETNNQTNNMIINTNNNNNSQHNRTGTGVVASTSQEEDEWSDFVSMPGVITAKKSSVIVEKQQQQQQQSKSSKSIAAVEDDWTEFVSSTAAAPVPSAGPNFIPWGAASSYGSSSFSQPGIPNRPTTHLPPPRLAASGADFVQFVDPAPFFISSTAAGLQSMFGGGGGGAAGGGRGNGNGVKKGGGTGRK